MKIRSIRVQLPVSYAAIALLTALLLGSILLFALQQFYSTQERNYLSTNAALMSPGIANVLAGEESVSDLPIYIQNMSYFIQARIRVFDPEGLLLADSGELQTQQFIFTNLTPEGMSAEILREGRADRYLFHASINVIDQSGLEHFLKGNPAFLAQVPLQPALFGAEPGTQGMKGTQHSDQKVSALIQGSDGQIVGRLEVSEGLAFGGNIIQDVARAWIVSSIGAVLISALIGWKVSSRFTGPVTELTTVTDSMAGGNLSSRAAIRTRDEFYSLGQSFNSMAEELEKTIETLRNFVTDAAHELLTPVAALRVNLELVRDESNPKKMLDEAELQTIRLQSIVESLLDLSTIEAENANFKPVSVGEIFSSLEETWEPLASQKGIQLQIRYPLGDISILGNQTQIVKALGNLLDNAVKFSGPAGSIQLGFEETSEMVQFYVKDQGIGIPEKEVEKVFQRFFRGRNTSEIPGSGLGLAIVKAIMNRHKGDVTLESTKEGTIVRLGFQRAD